MDFETLLNNMKPKSAATLAVAAADDDYALRAVCQAHDRGIATPILCGDGAAIQKAADEAGLDISGFEIAEGESGAAQTAVSLVRAGHADALMKGRIQTADLLRAVLDKENGLRGEGLLSHVAVVYSAFLDRTLLLTDAAIVPYPSLEQKVRLIENAVAAARGIGIAEPRVAVLAAVEVVNPKMPATVEAAELTRMNRNGQIRGCIVDGPLAMDLAISREAARHKGVDSPVAGKADILLFHNIEAANSVLKTFTNASQGVFGGVVMGAAAPIVLTSRSDSEQNKLYSIACAAKIAARG